MPGATPNSPSNYVNLPATLYSWYYYDVHYGNEPAEAQRELRKGQEGSGFKPRLVWHTDFSLHSSVSTVLTGADMGVVAYYNADSRAHPRDSDRVSLGWGKDQAPGGSKQ